MTNRYLRSTDGSNADTGLTWLLAKATVQGMSSQDVPGDTIYVSQVHAETTAAPLFFDFGGSLTAPVRFICGNDAAEPPTAVATTATITVTSATASIQISGSMFCYGVSFINNGSLASPIWLHNGVNQAQIWEQCSFQINSATTSNIFINASTASSGDVTWRDCTVKFGASGSTIVSQSDVFTWEGGSVLAGGTSVANLLDFAPARCTAVTISGVDFSQLAATFNFVGTPGGGSLLVKNCLLPASWSGNLISATAVYSMRCEMYNCNGSGGTAIALRVEDFSGIIRDESTVVRSFGANDGNNSFSWKLSANTQCNVDYGQLKTPPIAIWNDVTSVSVTFAISIMHDSVTALKDNEVWLEVEALTSSAGPKSAFITDYPASPIAASANQTSDSTTWTTTGLTNPNQQILQVSCVPMQRGIVNCKVVMGKASYTLYADPKIQVS